MSVTWTRCNLIWISGAGMEATSTEEIWKCNDVRREIEDEGGGGGGRSENGNPIVWKQLGYDDLSVKVENACCAESRWWSVSYKCETTKPQSR